MSKVAKAIHALRTPDASLARVPNTVRQSIADVMEQQQEMVDRYGVALMMIKEGADNHKEIAARALTDPQRLS